MTFDFNVSLIIQLHFYSAFGSTYWIQI